jgi:hypothetical protein
VSGETLWSHDYSSDARTKIVIALRDCAGKMTESVGGIVAPQILRETGAPAFPSGGGVTAVDSALSAGDEIQVATVLEALRARNPDNDCLKSPTAGSDSAAGFATPHFEQV